MKSHRYRRLSEEAVELTFRHITGDQKASVLI
jgi:hypothetical protein